MKWRFGFFLIINLKIKKKGEKLSKTASKSPDFASDKKSRLRRKAADVERHYKCPGTNCHKAYGYIIRLYIIYVIDLKGL